MRKKVKVGSFLIFIKIKQNIQLDFIKYLLTNYDRESLYYIDGLSSLNMIFGKNLLSSSSCTLSLYHLVSTFIGILLTFSPMHFLGFIFAFIIIL